MQLPGPVQGLPGVGWHSSVAVVYAAALKHVMAHARQLLDDVKMKPQTLRLYMQIHNQQII